MTKKEFVKAVAEKCELTQDKAEKAFDTVWASVAESLQKGERVQIAGFGTFDVKQRAERKGRNPKTGEELTIPARNTVTFKVSKAVKESVNQ